LIPVSKLALARAVIASVLLVGVAGCELFKKSEEVQSVVNRRALGMQAGDFFQRYGTAFRRDEQSDGTTVYGWISQIPPAAPGYLGQDDRTCTLQLTVDARGKVVSADVVTDYPGRTSSSRCGEIFKPAP
jgi:hypothetical protein